MLPWVCVFCGLQRMIESVKMKEKKMKLKLRMLETNEKKMKRKVRDKRKSDR
jgi:hypothetical protein